MSSKNYLSVFIFSMNNKINRNSMYTFVGRARVMSDPAQSVFRTVYLYSICMWTHKYERNHEPFLVSFEYNRKCKNTWRFLNKFVSYIWSSWLLVRVFIRISINSENIDNATPTYLILSTERIAYVLTTDQLDFHQTF